VALAFVDVGAGFIDRAAVVVAVGFSQDLWVLQALLSWIIHLQNTLKPSPYFKKTHNISLQKTNG